ncbi:cell division protein FtsI/penicillin-binding protein 2 [Paenibacillus sp. SORGH_AS306]|uniref:peptidoglycan D,D-transpeptidase FtsI family protein n=1 Tax=unclassified Paenibacillus TaxID=185978 RepID=UPI00278B095C|nr:MULTISPECIES: penicillin-binding protein 2 [unclassified Paenibacillus]MDQ1235556.1 cell division protein FtsI/penicillin-binding protein 2 [Paenibacillus sp. SORGH_AS_0306]MDR6112604.1 cell division protein FtsI/penicillin-binding protein 2 [Paenibacillus sp. SORGH_AS_0338]
MKKWKDQSSEDLEVSHRKQFSVRLNIFFFSVFVIFSVLIVRLAILQFVEGPTLKEKEAYVANDITPIVPTRGNIYDATGTKVAYSLSMQSLYFTLSKDYRLDKNKPELYQIIGDLKRVFNKYGDPDRKMTAAEIEKEMDIKYIKNYGFTPRRIKKDLSNSEIAYFLEHKDQFQGIEVREESVREYSKDQLAVQTVGYLKAFYGVKTSMNKYKNRARLTDEESRYIDTELVGVDGLEYTYQDELRGTNGVKKTPINALNRVNGRATLTPPVKGNNLWMTIDKNLQLVAQQAITDQLAYLHSYSSGNAYAPNAQTGYAVAMEVETGNVVAIASMPDYDSNIWGNAPSQDQINEILSRSANGTIREVYRGKGASSMVLMGSVIKPLSVLIGMEEGLFTPYAGYSDRGYAEFGKAGHETRVRNALGEVLNYLTPTTAIQKSSNAFMVDMVGKRMYNKHGAKSVNVWDKYMKEFGLGVTTGSGLPYENEGRGEYMNIEAAGSTQAAMAYASFGQQGRYTTLQLAQYATTLANRGKRLKPQFVSKITDAEGNVVKKIQPEVLNTVNFPDEYWNTVIQGMRSKVPVFENYRYDVARKTGTSQQSIYGKLVDNGVFIAFAPRNNPKLAIAVMIPEGGFGSRSAAPVAKKIFDAYDQYYGLDGVPKGKAVTEETTTE